MAENPPPWGVIARSAYLVAAASVGAVIATVLSLPAGTVLGAVLGAMIANVSRPGPPLPRPVREVGKILLGIVVGLSFAPELLAQLASIVVPVVVAVAALIVVGLGIAVALNRWFGWDMATALYASTPGGLSELAMTAQEVGGKTHVVVAVHTVRVATIVMLGPPALSLLLTFWPG